MPTTSLRDRLSSMTTERRSYTLQMLTQHLHQAKQYEHLHALFTYDWMRLRVENDGNYGGFLKDVEIAWNSTDQTQYPEVALQIRYGLMQSSIKSLAANVPAILFPLFLENGVWSFDESVTFAMQIPDLEQRCEALFQLGKASNLLEAQKHAVFMEVLKVQWPYRAEEKEEHILRGLSGVLPADLFPEALRLARNFQDAALRQAALSALAFHAPNQEDQQALYTDALALAHSFSSSTRRVEALANLIPLLTPDLIEELLNTIAATDEAYTLYTDFTCLRHIAPYVPPQFHAKVIDLSRASLDARHQVNILVALSKSLPDGGSIIPSSDPPSLPISAVPPWPLDLKQRELTQALQLIREEIKEESDQTWALCSLASIQPDLQEEAFERILVQGRQNRVYGLDDLVKQIKPDLHNRILEVFSEFLAEENRIELIGGLAPHLTLTQITRLLEQITLMRQREHRLKAMGLLIHFLPNPQREEWTKEAHRLASLINDQQIRESIISTLAKYQEKDLERLSVDPSSLESSAARLFLRRLANNMRKHLLRYDWVFIRNLRYLFPLLNEDQLDESFDIWVKESSWHRAPFIAYFMNTMASYASKKLLVRMFDFIIAQFRKHEPYDTYYSYLCALADIAKMIPLSSFSHVVTSLQSIPDDSLRTCAYVALAPFFHIKAVLQGSRERTFDLAMNTARSISDVKWRRYAFFSLLPDVPIQYFDEAFSESWEIIPKGEVGWGSFHQYVLIRLSPLLPAEFFEPVIDALDSENNLGPARNAILHMLTLRLLSLPNETKYMVWNGVLRKFANGGRPRFLLDLAAFLPVVEQFDQQNTLRKIIKDVLMVSTWWQ